MINETKNALAVVKSLDFANLQAINTLEECDLLGSVTNLMIKASNGLKYTVAQLIDQTLDQRVYKRIRIPVRENDLTQGGPVIQERLIWKSKRAYLADMAYKAGIAYKTLVKYVILFQHFDKDDCIDNFDYYISFVGLLKAATKDEKPGLVGELQEAAEENSSKSEVFLKLKNKYGKNNPKLNKVAIQEPFRIVQKENKITIYFSDKVPKEKLEALILALKGESNAE